MIHDVDGSQFREQMVERGLGWEPGSITGKPKPSSWFTFYSNSGDILCKKTPDDIYNLLILARDCQTTNPAPRYLLGLRTERKRLALQSTFAAWDRYGEGNPEYVSLREWLTEEGFDLSVFES